MENGCDNNKHNCKESLTQKQRADYINAATEVIEKYKDSIFRFILLQVENYDVTEDILQETVLKFFENPVNAIDQGLRNRVFAIARNLIISYYRRIHLQKRAEDSLKANIYEDCDDPAELVQQTEIETRIIQGVSKLPQKQHEVILLRYYDFMSIVEIAEVLGVPYDTARNRLRRAKEKLELMLTERENNL